MNYTGTYINLDRRPDRRTAIEAELSRRGILEHYRRFAAVEGNGLSLDNPHLSDGEMGCFSSHFKVMQKNLEHNKPLHVIEDDVLLAPATASIIQRMIDNNLLDGHDIIYTDFFIPIHNHTYKSLKQLYDATVPTNLDGTGNHDFRIIDLKGIPFGSTSSYIVNPSSIGKLHDLYAKDISNQPRESNDLFIRRLCNSGALKVSCIFPFITSVALDEIVETDIARPNHKLSFLAPHLVRYALFIGADLKKCQESLDKFIPLPEPDDKLAQIMTHVLAFSLTTAYNPFR
jgi:hypothetical protein